MIIKINDLLIEESKKKHFSEEYQIDPELFKKYLVKEFGNCKIEVDLYEVNKTMFIDFEYDVDVVYSCARCLTDVKRHLSKSSSREIVNEGDKFGEDVGVLIVDDEIIDLEKMLLESLYINLETAVLCKDTCKGLCPKCGVDLNEDTCECNLNEVDPRFAKLKDLKDKLDK
jgi:uncharacterized protein